MKFSVKEIEQAHKKAEEDLEAATTAREAHAAINGVDSVSLEEVRNAYALWVYADRRARSSREVYRNLCRPHR